jgi:hypothetical protein
LLRSVSAYLLFRHFILVVLREISDRGTYVYHTRIHYRFVIEADSYFTSMHFHETVQFYSAVGPELFILDSDPTFQVFSDLYTDLICPSKAK